MSLLESEENLLIFKDEIDIEETKITLEMDHESQEDNQNVNKHTGDKPCDKTSSTFIKHIKKKPRKEKNI